MVRGYGTLASNLKTHAIEDRMSLVVFFIRKEKLNRMIPMYNKTYKSNV